VVWAIDLDSADSLSAQYLESGSTMDNRNGFESQKTLAKRKQNHLQQLGFWTPCMTDKDRACPGSYHQIGIVGHRNVYDFDHFKEVESCHGGLNRLLCIRIDLIGQKRQWHRNAKGASDIP